LILLSATITNSLSPTITNSLCYKCREARLFQFNRRDG
jgi:hypothetical protein